jgi:CspA family cold shock protein
MRPESVMTMAEILTGTVKWFNAEKGYGFITTADRGDLFVHLRALGEGRTSLDAGALVYFTLHETPKGVEAANVKVGTPPPPPKPALPTVELPTGAAPASSNLRLTGRPAAVQPLGRPGQAPSLFAFALDVSAELSLAMPKALPASGGATACLVLVSAKHWRRVAAALEADPEDALVIDGYAALDPLAPGMITVRATSVATLAQLSARRAAQAKHVSASEVSLPPSPQIALEGVNEAENSSSH